VFFFKKEGGIKIMKYIVISLVIVAIGGCAVTATPILTGNSGEKSFFLDCGRQGEAKCIAKANEVCPQGYEITKNDSQTSWSFNRYGGGQNTVSQMTIQCK
jgi:hypothetical protein